MSEYETLLIEDRGPARIITINRPDALNALDADVVDELARAVEAAASVDSVRGVVLTGAGGKAFVAGADIKSMSEMQPEQALAFAGKGHAVGELLEKLPKPSVAAVEGFALGGGCELALACDFIYASTKSKFGQPEVKLGVIPGFGGTQRMLRRVGVAKALQLCLTGEMFGAQEAHRLGLVAKIVEPGQAVDAAVSTIETIATMGPLAVAKCKAVIYRGADMPLDEANALEATAFSELFDTTDQKEGMAAFLAKRAAKFTGA
jgi:enoyl-CoA hydratase